ncbi:hypothetical protein FKM82_019079 [Ascaphus truei]
MQNGLDYREVRQYRTGHNLVRFYFLTRVYSHYMESILSDFQAGPQPDVLIINSCVWDISRYGLQSMQEYKANLETLFNRLNEVLPPECLVVWNMSMPLGVNIKGGFMIPELQPLNLRHDIIEGNFYSATLADRYKLDVLDFHYHFRFDMQNRTCDGVHWNQLAHRKITQILLTHIASAWGVRTPEVKSIKGFNKQPATGRMVTWRSGNAHPSEKSNTQDKARPRRGVPSLLGQYCPGYTSFEGNCNDSRSDAAFYSDSPTGVGDRSLAYLNFEENDHKPAKAPRGGVHPFNGMNMNMTTVPNPQFPAINFGIFPHHTPSPQNYQGNQRFPRHQSRRRAFWPHPYRPHAFLPGIY